MPILLSMKKYSHRHKCCGEVLARSCPAAGITISANCINPKITNDEANSCEDCSCHDHHQARHYGKSFHAIKTEYLLGYDNQADIRKKDRRPLFVSATNILMLKPAKQRYRRILIIQAARNGLRHQNECLQCAKGQPYYITQHELSCLSMRVEHITQSSALY